ncbi:MAG: response regulator receiver protein [Desulfovibrio sp.]|uniref:response regulator receiver protein n=1 Tax=Desulfovibrio sp. TaxID=885 RepID=UPI0039E57ECB
MKSRHILLQTRRPDAWTDFVAQLQVGGCTVGMAESFELCKEAAQREHPVLVVLDPPSCELARSWVTALMMIDAGMHTAVVTDMPAEVFHDEMEGLGILTSLPLKPAAQDAHKLLELLKEVMGSRG